MPTSNIKVYAIMVSNSQCAFEKMIDRLHFSREAAEKEIAKCISDNPTAAYFYNIKEFILDELDMIEAVLRSN